MNEELIPKSELNDFINERRKIIVKQELRKPMIDFSTDGKIWWLFEGVLYLGVFTLGIWLGFVLLS
tara:strand:+ start:2718 stop:2915 length:198 start_codon:yes stop_codon:yes gene_type:complete